MRTPPPPPEMTCGFLIQWYSAKTMWFIGVEVEQETSAPPPKKNPGSTPYLNHVNTLDLLLIPFLYIEIQPPVREFNVQQSV